MILKPGDIVCVTDLSPDSFMSKMLGKLIVAVSKARSADGEAEFRHSLIITSMEGDTYEALWRFGRQNIFTDYMGYKLIIGRHKDMTPEGFEYAHKILSEKYEGKLYPFVRLTSHITSITAKCMPMVKPVCSELSRLLLLLSGCRDYSDEEFHTFDNPDEHFKWASKKAKGYTPDCQADAIRGDDLFDVVEYGAFNQQALSIGAFNVK